MALLIVDERDYRVSVASTSRPRDDAAMAGYTDIELEIADPAAVIRLDRPDKLNAFTYHTLGEIRHAVDACVADPRVVGIVVTGAGRGFCAGLDVQVLAEVTGRAAPPERRPRIQPSCRGCSAICSRCRSR